MKELIARLEKATGPDRELDRDIGRSFETLPTIPFKGPSAWDMHKGMFWVVGTTDTANGPVEQKWSRTAPAYSSSLDAAMTLMPEGWEITNWRISKEKDWSNVIIQTFDGDGVGKWERLSASARTPAIALCIAVLKTREAGAK